MLKYATLFLVIAVITGILGFGILAGTAAIIAKVFFAIFIMLFVISQLNGRKT